MRKSSGFLAFILSVAMSAQGAVPTSTGIGFEPEAFIKAVAPIYEITAMKKRGEAGYFTLSPNHPFIGPVFSENTTPQYVAEVFGLLIQAADAVASEFYEKESKENFTYWSFIVAALAVPHHESKLMHAQQVIKGDVLPMCTPALNELLGIKSPRMLPVLRQQYREPVDPVFPNCSSLKGIGSVQQLLISAVNRHDLGLMQLNAPTFAEALTPDIYLNLFNTIRFGIYHLYGKYKDVRLNNANYPCLARTNIYPQLKGSRASSFYNLVRGTWGGGYNIGNTLVKSVCRFADPKDPNYSKDVNFKKHLDALVIHENSIFHRYLPPNSLERKALDEIVYNFRAAFTTGVEAERNLHMTAVKNTDYFSKYMTEFSKPLLNPRYYVNAKTLAFRWGPVRDDANICGIVHGGGSDKRPALHVEKDPWSFNNPRNGNQEETWAAVRLSKYSKNIEYTSSDPKCYLGDRDLFFVDGSLITEVKKKDLVNADLIGHVGGSGRKYGIRHFYSLDSSIIAQASSGDTLNIVATIKDKVKIRDIKTGRLKDSPFKWYKVLVPGKTNQFGYINEDAFENVTERDQ